MKEILDSLPEKIKSKITDSWKNILTKLNDPTKDKRVNAQAEHIILSMNEVEEIYSSDPIARKMVDKIPSEGTREWIEYSGDDTLEKKIEDYNNKLKMQEVFLQAWSWGNLYGGCVVLMVTDDKDNPILWEEPLDVNNIDNIHSLIIFTRWEMYPLSFINDIFNPDFGEPEIYQVTPRKYNSVGSKKTPNIKISGNNNKNVNNLTASNFRVHRSRLLFFHGERLPMNKYISNQYWHDSVLSSRVNELMSYHQAHDSIAHLLTDFRQNVIKIKGLADMVGNDETNQKLVNRISLMNTTRSVFSATLIDEDEDYTQNTPTLTGIKDLLSAVDNCMVANSDVPHTILLGESPKGNLGSDGKSTQRDFYNQVRNEQKRVLKPKIEQYHNVLQKCKEGPTKGQPFPDDLSWDFVTLWKPTQEEQSIIRKNISDADKTYMDYQVLNPNEVRKSRFGGKNFSIETTIDSKYDDIEPISEEEEKSIINGK